MFATLAATTFAATLATRSSIPTVETHASIPTVEIAPNVHLPFLTMGGVNATYQQSEGWEYGSWSREYSSN